MVSRTDCFFTSTWTVIHFVSLFLVILKIAGDNYTVNLPWCIVLFPFIIDGLCLSLIVIVTGTLYLLSKRYRHK